MNRKKRLIMRLSLFRCMFLLSCLFLLFSCVTASESGIPIRPMDYTAVSYDNLLLEQIKQKDPELAYELSILPDMKNGIDDKEKRGLENILELYTQYPKDQDRLSKALQNILDEGIPDKRFYSGALQAFFWMSCNNDSDYIVAQHLIVLTEHMQKMLLVSWGNCLGDNWSNWDEVKKRLSSPELIAYFIKNGFTYVSDPPSDPWYSVEKAFKTRRGDCDEIARIVHEALKANGYKTWLLETAYTNNDGHTSGIFIDPQTGLYRSIEQWIGVTDGFRTTEELSRYIVSTMRDSNTVYKAHRIGFTKNYLYEIYK